MEVLSNLVTRLELDHNRKKDLVVPASKIEMNNNGNLIIDGEYQEYYKPNQTMSTHIAEKLKIPAGYYNTMQELKPDLLATNVNAWLDHNKDKKYLIRGFSDLEQLGTGRAFLSDRYNIIDNYDVLLAALEAIQNTGVNVEIKYGEVTEKKMYLHVVCPEIELQANEVLKDYLTTNNAAGNGIISGFVLSNSEVGAGKFEIRPRAVICKCNNGLIVKDDRFAKYHLGAEMQEGSIVWSERTKQKNYELIISQTQDAVNTFLSKDYLGKMIERIEIAHKTEFQHPIDTVQNVCTHLKISQDHKRNILSNFIKDGLTNGAGLFNAITRETQKMQPDLQNDIEAAAGDLLTNLLRFDKPHKN